MSTRWLFLSPLAFIVACGDAGSFSAAGTETQGSTAGTQDATTQAATATGISATEPTGGSGGVTDSGTTTGTTGAVDPTTGSTTSTTLPPETSTSTADASTADASTTDASTTSTTSTSTTSTGDSTSTGSTGDDSTSSSSTGDSSTGENSTGEPIVEGMWLVSLEDTSSPTRLYKIDLETGAGTHLCDLDTINNYNTSTFNREGLLFAANADTKNLEIIDPCTCGRTVVGPTMVDALPGITADQALGLYGLETTIDQFVEIDPDTGLATPIGPVGLDWGTGGLTWSDVLQDTYAINGTDDKLYTINHITGQATVLIQTNYNFGSVGIEWHPKTQEIYACSNPAQLLKVSEKTGEVTVVGPMNLPNQAAHCDNLAAPWEPIACVEDK